MALAARGSERTGRLLRAVAAVLFAAHALAALAADTAQLSGAALGDALRRGGYVIYFRHASTDFGQNDDGMTSFDDCSRQRNLTEKGRAEARAIGEGVKRAAIPVSTVLASPYCRTRETARLIFGRDTASNDVRGGPASDDGQRYAALRKLMSTRVPAGSNVAIVSHGNPFRAIAGPPYLQEGEAAVVEPLGDAAFRIVGRVPRDGWEALGR